MRRRQEALRQRHLGLDVLVRIDRERDTAKLLPFEWKVAFADEVAERQQAAPTLIQSQ